MPIVGMLRGCALLRCQHLSVIPQAASHHMKQVVSFCYVLEGWWATMLQAVQSASETNQAMLMCTLSS